MACNLTVDNETERCFVRSQALAVMYTVKVVMSWKWCKIKLCYCRN